MVCFFDECVRAGPENCTLASLVAAPDQGAAAADPKEVLREKILALAADLREQSLSVYVNNSVFGMLDYPKIMYKAIFPALSKPLL